MAWIWMVPVAGAVLLWAISLGRILSYPAPSCVPPSLQFMAPPRYHRRSRNVLLVVAHPDDESMFFAPTILFLKSKGHNIHILCMSRGNADSFGNTRKEELYHACDTLKIPHEHVKVLDHQKLQDGFHEKWDHGLVAEFTSEHVQPWAIETIVTFDSYGVSGHPNHKDAHHGICKFLQANRQGNIEAWELASLNILRKYSGPVDIWLSSLISSSSSKQSIYTLVNSRPSKIYEAMAAHRSQWVCPHNVSWPTYNEPVTCWLLPIAQCSNIKMACINTIYLYQEPVGAMFNSPSVFFFLEYRKALSRIKDNQHSHVFLQV